MRRNLAIVALLFATPCFAANWYVDSANDGGTENGTSWATAWGKLADISWASMANGDTLYISGGTVSKTYAERMTVGHAYITIKPGQASPHNGQVIIAPTTGDTAVVVVSAKDNVTISGSGGVGTYGIKIDSPITSAGGSTGALLISGSGANGIYEYLEITSPDGPTDGGCIRYTASQGGVAGSEIRYNWIHDCYQDGLDLAQSPAFVKASGYGTALSIHHNIVENIHDDHIESTYGGLDIYNNTFRNRIEPVRGHPDGHQLYNSYYRIYNNSYSGFMNASSGNSIVYWEPDGGGGWNFNQRHPQGFKLYNNTFYEDNTASTTLTGIQLGFSDSLWTDLSDFYIANNTFIGRVGGAAWVQSFGGTTLCADRITNMYVVNNVFDNSSSMAWSISAGPSPCTTGNGTPASYGSWNDNQSWTIDYNLYANNGTNQINFTAYASWIASTGTQDSGKSSSSNITAPTFVPPAGSPVIDNGVDLSSLMSFTTDKAGTSRPSGAAWDIGAYEYGGTDNTPNTFSFPDNVATELNTTITSASITVAGIDNTTSISISGTTCTYSLNGAAYTADAGTVTLGDNVTMQQTSANAYSTPTSGCTLTIGGVNDSGAPWTATTKAATPPAAVGGAATHRAVKIRGKIK